MNIKKQDNLDQWGQSWHREGLLEESLLGDIRMIGAER
jgi:hypothetical protein